MTVGITSVVVVVLVTVIVIVIVVVVVTVVVVVIVIIVGTLCNEDQAYDGQNKDLHPKSDKVC